MGGWKTLIGVFCCNFANNRKRIICIRTAVAVSVDICTVSTYSSSEHQYVEEVGVAVGSEGGRATGVLVASARNATKILNPGISVPFISHN